jgi:hypothetical protein
MQKKYWLKWGLWFGSFGVILIILEVLIARGPLEFLSTGSFDAFGFGFELLVSLPAILVERFIGFGAHSFISSAIITILSWFALGAFLGLGYDGMKKNRETPSNQNNS